MFRGSSALLQMKRILRTVTNEKNPAHYYNAEGPNTGLKAQKILRTFITV